MGEGKGVYAAISAVQKELAETGIKKTQENTFDRYKFRGIDDLYNFLGPVLARNALVIFPKVTNREMIERATQKGGVQIHTIIDVEYTFAGPDGSFITVPVTGEAMDRGDKSINKAMSAAYKLACFQTFCIPLDGQDSEQETHEAGTKTDVRKAVEKKGNRVVDAALVGETWDTEQAQHYCSAIRGCVAREDWAGFDQLHAEFKDDHVMAMAIWADLTSLERSAIKKHQQAQKAA